MPRARRRCSSGDLDLIENVPPEDVARLKDTKGIAVFGRPADRVAFLLPNVARDTLPLLTDRQGEKLDSNPLRDLRVRQAMSLGLDRRALVDRALSGQGAPRCNSCRRASAGGIRLSPSPRSTPRQRSASWRRPAIRMASA